MSEFGGIDTEALGALAGAAAAEEPVEAADELDAAQAWHERLSQPPEEQAAEEAPPMEQVPEADAGEDLQLSDAEFLDALAQVGIGPEQLEQMIEQQTFADPAASVGAMLGSFEQQLAAQQAAEAQAAAARQQALAQAEEHQDRLVGQVAYELEQAGRGVGEDRPIEHGELVAAAEQLVDSVRAPGLTGEQIAAEALRLAADELSPPTDELEAAFRYVARHRSAVPPQSRFPRRTR